MYTIDEVEEMLHEVVDGLPKEIYGKLNGGVILLPETKYNEVSEDNDLVILGQYHSGGPLGRYISIYYGSFIKAYGNKSKEVFFDKLVEIVKHELTHHLENLAGVKDLEEDDEDFLRDFMRRKFR
jgi:predicted Zn-dependent protease with MMP-like domain